MSLKRKFIFNTFQQKKSFKDVTCIGGDVMMCCAILGGFFLNDILRMKREHANGSDTANSGNRKHSVYNAIHLGLMLFLNIKNITGCSGNKITAKQLE